jgi:epoxyqueuosine reductase
MDKALREWAAQRGYKVAWYDGEVVGRAFDRIARLEAEGAFESGFFSKFLSWTADPAILAAARTRTLILVAIPSPAQIVTFEDEGRRRELVLPPTYLRYYPLFEEVLADLTTFTGDRLKLRLLSAPLKTIAGLTGFARFGKNNIIYVDGLGSGVQLAGFATEMSLPGGAPPGDGVPKMLDECLSCRACRHSCPMGAIAEDRFLLHGERCLTGFTESDGELPGEFGRLRTPTLIGCLACQDRCPANRGRLRLERIPDAFSGGETAYLLGERGDGPPKPELAAKVRALGCTDLTLTEAGPSAIFRRNLRASLRP